MNHGTVGKALIAAVIAIFFFASESSGWWFIYDKPAFRGRFIDAETKEPIQGGVVAVIYWKHPLIGGPAGASSSILKVKETLTGKNGEFFFPPFTKILHPFAEESKADFIFFKSGYGDIIDNRASPPRPMSSDAWEKFFSESKIGEQGRIIDTGKIINVIFGVVEIRRIKTREDWLGSRGQIPSDLTPKELPEMFRALDEDRKRFGRGGMN